MKTLLLLFCHLMSVSTYFTMQNVIISCNYCLKLELVFKGEFYSDSLYFHRLAIIKAFETTKWLCLGLCVKQLNYRVLYLINKKAIALTSKRIGDSLFWSQICVIVAKGH